MKKPIITEEEKQKIKEMDSTRKKIGYIWDYYKLWIIGAVVLVGLVVYFLLCLQRGRTSRYWMSSL